MIDLNCFHEDFGPLKKIKDYIKYKIDFSRNHPNYFYADGLVVFVGPQGSGKTLSAVNYVYKLMKKYPNAKLVTNLMLQDYPIVEFEEFFKRNYSLLQYDRYCDGELEDDVLDRIKYDYQQSNRVFRFDNNDDFAKYSNGEEGVIYLVDEIQLYLNSLESKNVNMEVMTQISQQRKQRKHIVCTSQVFSRMAKPLREQFSCVVACNSYMKCIQRNRLVDRDSLDDNQTDDSHIKGKVLSTSWFIHSPKYYKRYDTYYVIEKGKFAGREKGENEIYDIKYTSPI